MLRISISRTACMESMRPEERRSSISPTLPSKRSAFPKLGSTSLGHYATKVTSVIYKWLSGRFSLAGFLGAVIKRNWNRHEAERPEREKETGLKDQL